MEKLSYQFQYSIMAGRANYGQYKEQLDWLRDNMGPIGERWHSDSIFGFQTFYFHEETDMITFKLVQG